MVLILFAVFKFSLTGFGVIGVIILSLKRHKLQYLFGFNKIFLCINVFGFKISFGLFLGQRKTFFFNNFSRSA
jgi:hypothetical protein